MVDDQSNLLGLYVHPVESKSNLAETDAVDWQKVLQLAGIDGGQAEVTELSVQPNVYCEECRAWKVGKDEGEITVQAGVVEGTFNYFQIIGLKQAFRMPPRAKIDGQMIVTFFGNCFIWLVAWLNLFSSAERPSIKPTFGSHR